MDTQVMMPVEFTNDHMPALVKFKSGGLKDVVYLRVTPGERINEQIRSISIPLTQSNCLFVTINMELWLKTPDIDIEFLVIPRMKNGTQSEGLVCVLNGRLWSGGRPESFP